MKDKEIDIDAEEGIYTADDVYGATSDFWGGSEEPETTEGALSISSDDTRVGSEPQVETPE